MKKTCEVMNTLLISCGIAIDVYSLHAVYNNRCYQFTSGIFGSNKISYIYFKIKLYVDHLHTLNIITIIVFPILFIKLFYHAFFISYILSRHSLVLFTDG
jgi:hypothetical protein